MLAHSRLDSVFIVGIVPDGCLLTCYIYLMETSHTQNCARVAFLVLELTRRRPF